MTDVKKCLRALAMCWLLMFANVSAEILDGFPYYNLSSVFLLTVSLFYFLRWYLRVGGQPELKHAVRHLAGMILFLFFLRCFKYSVTGNVSASGRYCWYLYYLPILAMPMFLLRIALCIYYRKEQLRRLWGVILGVTLLLVLLVLTNDLHQQVFRFRPGFLNWDGAYSYGPGFLPVMVWEYLLYTAAVAILVLKYPNSCTRHAEWLILMPFVIGITLNVLIATGHPPTINGHHVIEMQPALCSMAVGVLECCIALGLIPTNESVGRLFPMSGLQVQITDRQGSPLYKTATAAPLHRSQLTAPDGTRIAEHTILRRRDFPGGFGFWQEDVAELDSLKEKLQETKALLSEETELIRLKNEMQTRQRSLEQRTAIYDAIALRTLPQAEEITRLARQAAQTADPVERDSCRRHIALLGVYIKRCANLMLLSADSGTLSLGELGLALAELLRYLKRCGIPAELMHTASGTIPAESALLTFEVIGSLLEEQLPALHGCYVNLQQTREETLCKLVLENLTGASIASLTERLAAAAVRLSVEQEEDTLYLTLRLPKGGDGA